jgi:ribosomal protein S18 acetylase RimI-like enzyme
MQLPIVSTPTETLIRLFHKTERHWTQHLAEEAQLSCGSAFCNPNLNRVWDANRLLDGALPEGKSAAEVFDEVQSYFSQQGARCMRWGMNPSSSNEVAAPLVAHLEKQGFSTQSHDIMYLARMPASVSEVAGLKIIPARASYKHATVLAEQWAASWREPQLVDAAMMHLDDPHCDTLIALRDGQPAAAVAVLAIGEIGRIDGVFVSPDFRRHGIGRTMMSRALEICARSLFKHVFLSCDGNNAPAIALYSQLGFQKIGQIVSYYAPDSGR